MGNNEKRDLGGDFKDSGASLSQPQGNVGLYYNFSPRFRAGSGYNYSRMSRSHTSTALPSLAGGVQAGDIYRNLNTNFHGAELTAECNLLGAACGGRLSLYVGAGAGCLFSVENNYTLSVKNEIISSGTGNKIQFTGHNDDSHHIIPFIPVTLSLEYAFLPQVAACIGGGYRFTFAGNDGLSPEGQAFATLGLKFNLK